MDYEDAISIVTQSVRSCTSWPKDSDGMPVLALPETEVFRNYDIDSLDIVWILSDIEQAVRDEIDVEISLSMGAHTDPAIHYATVASLAEYVVELTNA